MDKKEDESWQVKRGKLRVCGCACAWVGTEDSRGADHGY